jgi:hypothetical protein
MNLFWNFLRLHPLIHLDSSLSGVENHKTLRTVADVRLQFSAQVRLRCYVQVIGELLQELFTGKQRRSSLSDAKKRRLLTHNCRRTHNKGGLDRQQRNPRAFGFLSAQFFDVSQYKNGSKPPGYT